MIRFFPVALLFLTLPLFFYNLGISSLVNWDEAWYADIARNISQTGNLFTLYWNGEIYNDHPPSGFWLMAVILKVFGLNDFWARFASALAGFASIFTLYFLGKELFNKTVGLAAAVALSSSFWFIYRARSANLDSFLTLFFLLTFFLAIKSVKNKRLLLPFSISLSLLFLTKSLIPLTIIPALVICFYNSKFKIKDFLFPGIIFFIVVGLWFGSQLLQQPDYIQHYLMIGFPSSETKPSFLDNLKLTKEYLHNGIGKWFWPGILAIFLSLFLRQKRFLILSAFFFTFFLPFVFSSKGHIWHLIPLHPILILSFFGFMSFFLGKIIHKKVIVIALILFISFYFSFIQIKRMWYEFINIPSFISDEAILSTEAGRYKDDFFIDGGDFTPTAVFYSRKKVVKLREDGLGPLFERKEPFVLITYQWRLNQADIKANQYMVLKTDRDKILIRSLK